MPGVLSEEQITAFARDGFLSPVPVLSREEARGIREQLEAAEQRWPECLSGVNRNNSHLVFSFLDRLTHHPTILDVVEDLIGPDILVASTVLFIKEPRHEGFISWHQDGTYMGLEPNDGVTAWIALTPSNRTNGCMSMIPGSHRDGILEHHDRFSDNNLLTRGQEIDHVPAGDAVDLILEPGEVSFHHLQTIHGSQPNRSGDRRIGFAVQAYIRPDVRQTRAQGFAQHARGQTARSAMTILPRPNDDMKPSDVTLRTEINQVWSDVLYAGAQRRRDY